MFDLGLGQNTGVGVILDVVLRGLVLGLGLGPMFGVVLALGFYFAITTS